MNGRIFNGERIQFREVADNVFAALSPYKGIGWANAGFINKGKGLVVDTLFDLFFAQELKDFCVEIHGKAPGYVVNTHHNGDHIWGNQLFNESDIIGHRAILEDYALDSLELWSKWSQFGSSSEHPGERFLAQELDGFDFAGIKYTLPNITFESKVSLTLDDTIVEIIHVGPAHTRSDSIVWLPKQKVLFTGDIVYMCASTWTEEGIRNWTGVLDHITCELKPEVIIPGHGDICDLTLVAELKQYLQLILDSVEQYYGEDISPLEIAKKINISNFLHWPYPERILLSIHTLIQARKKLPTSRNWDQLAIQLIELRDYYRNNKN